MLGRMHCEIHSKHSSMVPGAEMTCVYAEWFQYDVFTCFYCLGLGLTPQLKTKRLGMHGSIVQWCSPTAVPLVQCGPAVKQSLDHWHIAFSDHVRQGSTASVSRAAE